MLNSKLCNFKRQGSG